MSFCVRRRTAVVALCVGVAHAALGQEPRRLSQPDSIPAELAGALMAAGGFPSEPQILVGALPGWLQARVYVPDGARLLGSAFIGTTTVAVVTVPQEPDAVIGPLKAELEKRGWKAPPPPMSYGGGFRNPPTTTVMGNAVVPTAVTLCGDDEQILMVRASRQRGGTQVLYRLTSVAGYGTCNPPKIPAGASRSPYPTLFNPSGASDFTAMRDCQQLTGASWGTNTQLRTAMSPQEILAHYARQMQDSGWRASTLALGVWTKPDSAGNPLQATLIVATTPRDSLCRDVSLQVRSARRP